MIKATRGEIEFAGTREGLMAELTMIIQCLFDEGAVNKEDLETVIDFATNPENWEKLDDTLVSFTGGNGIKRAKWRNNSTPPTLKL